MHSNCGGAWGHFRDRERFWEYPQDQSLPEKKNCKIFQLFFSAKPQHSVSRFIRCPSIGTKWFWTVQIVLVGSRSFWSGQNRFGRVRFKFSGLIFIICTCPKWFGPLTKTNWTRRKQSVLDQNHFWPIEEGQGISSLLTIWLHIYFLFFYHFFSRNCGGAWGWSCWDRERFWGLLWHPHERHQSLSENKGRCHSRLVWPQLWSLMKLNW